MPADAGLPKSQPRIGTYAVEHRVSSRHLLLQRCLVRPQGAPAVEAWRCIAHNVSATGVGITMPCPLEPGTVLEIEAWGLSGARRLEARVVYSRPVAFLWFCGCELAEPLNESELEAWLKGPMNWLPQDQPNLQGWLEEFPLL